MRQYFKEADNAIVEYYIKRVIEGKITKLQAYKELHRFDYVKSVEEIENIIQKRLKCRGSELMRQSTSLF